jgi:hypothetical protein
VAEDPPAPWVGLLDGVLHAHSVEQAQLAASDLIDVTLPGGAATSRGAADLVRLVRSSAGLRASPYRAYALAVLVAAAGWVNAWRRALAGGLDSPAARAGAAAEAETAAELARGCTDLADLTGDPDPEVRAQMYLLTGAAAVPAVDAAARLGRLIDGESDALARACAVQALVGAAARVPGGVPTGLAEQVRERIRSGSPLDRARVDAELESVTRTVAERDRLRRSLDLPPAGEAAAGPVTWPAEGV